MPRNCQWGVLVLFVILLLAGHSSLAMEMIGSFPAARTVVAGRNAQYAVRFDSAVDHRGSHLTITQQDRLVQNLQVILRSDPKALTASAAKVAARRYELHCGSFDARRDKEGSVPFTVGR